MGIIDERFINKEDLLEDILPDIKEALLPQFMQSLMPVGFAYIQFAGSPLPGDTLYNQEDGLITEDFTTEQLSSCVFAGTTWKLAVRAGDFLRQEGTRIIDEENNIFIGSENIGETQEDSFQGHRHNWGGSSNYIGGNTSSLAKVGVPNASDTTFLTNDPQADGENGEPRTDVETRPVNTAVRFWVRVA